MRSFVDSSTPRGRSGPTHIAILASVMGLALAGCAGTPATPSLSAATAGSAAASPSQSPAASAAGERTFSLGGRAMRTCLANGAAAVCGRLSVAEDRSDPVGRRIDLNVVILPATTTEIRPDPVFFLTGGPGGPATVEYAYAARTFSSLNRMRDFVLVDQRGTGGSNRLVIPATPDTTGLSDADADAKIKAWLPDALAALPGDPRFYTTAAAADDIDDVRLALGYERINLYGGSYGATAAQYYIRQHSEHLRSVVMDGGTLLEVPIFEVMAANSQRALDLMFDRCAADHSCAAAFPDVRTEFDALLATLAKAPVTTRVAHPWTGDSIVIDRQTLAGAVHAALLNDQATASLPRLIHAAYGGDWDAVGQAIANGIGPKSSDTSQLVMSAVIRCSEAWARMDPTETARLAKDSYIADVYVANAEALRSFCRYVPRGVLPADDAAAVNSRVPALVILGEADPQNPPANVAAAAHDLPNSTTVIVPGEGHTVGRLGCMPDLVATFVERGSAAGLDASCATSSSPLPPFALP